MKEHLEEAFNRVPQLSEEVSSLLFTHNLIAFLLKVVELGNKSIAAATRIHIMPILDYIQENITVSLSVPGLAEKAKVQ